jgi:hypothetical protein
MTRRPRALFALVVAGLAVVSSACGGGGTGTGASSTPAIFPTAAQATGFPQGGQSIPNTRSPCAYPAQITSSPSWMPDDLPLPDGSYVTQLFPDLNGYQRAIFLINMNTSDLARFVLREWPKAGWVLGRGESEPGEIEDQFTRPPAVGAFRARDQFCNPGYTLMLLIYTPDRTKLKPPGFTPSPSPTGTG